MQELIKKYGIKSKKSLGQNFLNDENILKNIARISNISDENIIEVGPGFGVLTKEILAGKPKTLTLVELDNFMIEILNDRILNNDFYIGETKFSIINQDILKYDVLFSDYKVIANIPYYITSPILHRFLYGLKNKPKEMIILMQKEVGEKILSKKSSVLSLFIAKKAKASKKIDVLKKSFTPSPKVDSIVLHFEIINDYDFVDDNLFLAFIKASFSNPRKKMINNLSSFGYDKKIYLEKLISLGFNENSRAEELSIENYLKLISN
ncbi:ribosomal RNA small subunit methyltransferase A [Candidatus Gracilibacteria bacterium]|nr:ribosomal RNA small subunit methyltransferase A [Candidatus Gracilibacteria bacterium]